MHVAKNHNGQAKAAAVSEPAWVRYLLITSASNVVLRWLERRYSAGSREAVR